MAKRRGAGKPYLRRRSSGFLSAKATPFPGPQPRVGLPLPHQSVNASVTAAVGGLGSVGGESGVGWVVGLGLDWAVEEGDASQKRLVPSTHPTIFASPPPFSALATT